MNISDHMYNAFNENMAKTPSIEYEERVVMFIDILGFGSLIESTKNDNKNSQENLKKILECFNQAIDDVYDISHRDHVQFSQFSDSFVISHIITNTDDIESCLRAYIMVIMIARFIIKAFLRNNILVRGGISQGKIFHKEGYLLFGPAMNDAYYLESKKAKYPRIILSKQIVDSIEKKFGALPSQTLSAIGVPLEIDSDTEVYIDYLDECSLSVLDSFPKHIPALLEKYGWLKRKLNQ